MTKHAYKKEYILTKQATALVCCFLSVFFIAQPAFAFYDDEEVSSQNGFTAAQLDFALSNNTLDSLIGPESLGEIDHGSVVSPESGSLPMQYTITTEGTGALCDHLTLEAKKNGIKVYDDEPVLDFVHATTTTFGSWEFQFDMPPTLPANAPGNGDTCTADIVFNGWRADVDTPAESGYTDEERLSLSFTARMVVLNEIYANPNSGVAPRDREYIELYNNGSTPVDTEGWMISEMAGATETFYPIVVAGAVAGEVQPYNGASTIIPSGGFLVLEFGGGAAHLNNDGDTVRLYDAGTVLLDAHAYPATAPGKSHVRVVDGIGLWIDPDPTPGKPNEMSADELRAAGMSEKEIALMMELAQLRNGVIAEEGPLPVEPPVETEIVTPDTASTTEIVTTEEPTSTPAIESDSTSAGGGTEVQSENAGTEEDVDEVAGASTDEPTNETADAPSEDSSTPLSDETTVTENTAEKSIKSSEEEVGDEGDTSSGDSGSGDGGDGGSGEDSASSDGGSSDSGSSDSGSSGGDGGSSDSGGGSSDSSSSSESSS